MKKIMRAMVGVVLLAGFATMLFGASDPETRRPWNDTYDAISMTVTNGSTIGLIGQKLILTGTGGALNGTNTITVTTPFPFRGECVIKAAAGSTNRIAIATNAVMRSSATILLVPDTVADTVIYYVTATNKAIVVSGTAY